jgi:hypothetical protein
MKRPISWHEDCLVNQKRSLQQEKERLERAQKSYDDLLTRVIFYEQQIIEAKIKGKNDFDSNKFNIKKVNK